MRHLVALSLVLLTSCGTTRPTPTVARRAAPVLLPSVRFARAEVALRDAPRGSVIGRLFFGGQVWVEEVRGDWAAFDVPETGQPPLRAWTLASGLTAEPVSPRVAEPNGGDVSIRDRPVQLRVPDTGLAFASTRCRPYVVSRSGSALRAVQRLGLIELSGLVTRVPDGVSPLCVPPPSPAPLPPAPAPSPPRPLPSGWVEVGAELAAEPFVQHMRAGRPIWELVGPPSRELCRRSRVVPHRPCGERGELRHTTWSREGRAYTTRRYSVDASGLLLSPPTSYRRTERGRTVTVSACMDTFLALVSGDEVRWILSSDQRDPRGYDPQSVVRWYATAAACQRDRRARKRSRRAGCG